jgi:aldose 1-epimerase
MITSILFLLGALCAICLAGCAVPFVPPEKRPFGTTSDGQAVDIYTLRNSKGCEARILNYGGIVVSLKVPDKNGEFGDVVLGFDDFAPYRTNGPYLGALIGRYGNRIANGKFTLDGKTYTLAQNNGSNSLHGGLKGFDKAIWTTKPIPNKLGPALELTYLSKDGEEGFPGNLRVTVVYTLTEDNALRTGFTATTDQPTLCNLTQHSYFNLAGRGDILNHEVTIAADKFTPVDSRLIPTGELRPVHGLSIDFTTPVKIGARIHNHDPEIQSGSGYDHNYVLNKKTGELALAARVTEETSGRVMEVLTTEPGMQFYSGNFIGDLPGKNGLQYHKHSGFAMEPEHFPDSPNHPEFPSTVLRPGQTYRNTIIYRFTTQPT